MVFPLIQQSRPSYVQGFARSKGESAFPHQWSGLVSAWVPALGPTGATLYDGSGHENDGALTAMDPATDWVSGRDGYALDFDGSSDYILCGHIPELVTSDLTFSGWFLPTSLVGNRWWISQWNANNGPAIFTIGTQMRAQVGDSTLRVLATVTVDVWQHIAMTLDASAPALKLYIDGSEVGEDLAGTALNTTTTTFSIAGPSLSGIDFFEGLIDSVLVHNRVLTPNKIQQLYVDSLAPFRRRRVMGLVSAGEAELPVNNLFINQAVNRAATY